MFSKLKKPNPISIGILHGFSNNAETCVTGVVELYIYFLPFVIGGDGEEKQSIVWKVFLYLGISVSAVSSVLCKIGKWLKAKQNKETSKVHVEGERNHQPQPTNPPQEQSSTGQSQTPRDCQPTNTFTYNSSDPQQHDPSHVAISTATQSADVPSRDQLYWEI